MAKFLGQKLKQLRVSMAMTLQDLAERTNLKISTISEIENEHTQPRPSTVKKLCQAFKIHAEYFYFDTSELEPELQNELLAEKGLMEFMTPDMVNFITDEKNIQYISIAMRLKQKKIPTELFVELIERWGTTNEE